MDILHIITSSWFCSHMSHTKKNKSKRYDIPQYQNKSDVYFYSTTLERDRKERDMQREKNLHDCVDEDMKNPWSKMNERQDNTTGE